MTEKITREFQDVDQHLDEARELMFKERSTQAQAMATIAVGEALVLICNKLEYILIELQTANHHRSLDRK